MRSESFAFSRMDALMAAFSAGMAYAVMLCSIIYGFYSGQHSYKTYIEQSDVLISRASRDSGLFRSVESIAVCRVYHLT
jgi:hypothetical protein